MTTECLDCAIDWHDVCADRRHDDEERDGCCCGRIGPDWDRDSDSRPSLRAQSDFHPHP